MTKFKPKEGGYDIEEISCRIDLYENDLFLLEVVSISEFNKVDVSAKLKEDESYAIKFNFWKGKYTFSIDIATQPLILSKNQVSNVAKYLNTISNNIDELAKEIEEIVTNNY